MLPNRSQGVSDIQEEATHAATSLAAGQRRRGRLGLISSDIISVRDHLLQTSTFSIRLGSFIPSRCRASAAVAMYDTKTLVFHKRRGFPSRAVSAIIASSIAPWLKLPQEDSSRHNAKINSSRSRCVAACCPLPTPDRATAFLLTVALLFTSLDRLPLFSTKSVASIFQTANRSR